MLRGLRRAGFALRRRWAGRPPLALVIAPEGYVRIPVGLLDPGRGPRILTFLEESGLVDPRAVVRAPPVTLAELQRVHSLDYLESLERPGATEHAIGVRLDDALEQALLAAHRAQVGATLTAARWAHRHGGVAVHLGGGFHHARRDRAAGFCLFHDLAVAIADLRASGFAGRIAVLDLDLHDGDGTRALFARDPTVHTYSVHNRPWDELDAVESTAIALGSGVEDARYLAAVRAGVPALLERFRPELVFYLAGADVAVDDALGDWRISPAGLAERDELVLDALERRGIPAVMLLAGGYGESAWRHSARSLARLFSGGAELEPPPTSVALMAHFRGLAAHLDPAELGDSGGELLTAEDVDEMLGAAPARRFLGFYSRAGIELALERLGYLDELRRLGFAAPVVEIAPHALEGDLLRVYGDAARSELLVELRARRERRRLPGFELLWLEWLLLQNPRVGFGGERKRLPGQSHPGLGLLRETMAALVLVCDRLRLDGIGVTASRFHPAAHSLGEAQLLDPAEEALLRSILEAVRGLPLAEAAHAVEEGGLFDESTGRTFEWRPLSMVFPISDRLEAWLERPERRAAAAAPGPRLALREAVLGAGRVSE